MQPPCVEMDDEWLGLAPPGRLVVVLGAATPGSDHDRAASRALGYYARWDREAVIAPHPGVDPDGCERLVRGAAAVVLPGGSPSRLLAALLGRGGLVAAAVIDVLRLGAAVSGASAGAMVLCDRVSLPDRSGDVVAGLGLLPGLVVPHFRRFPTDAWRDPVRSQGVETPRWGLPEAGGALIVDGSVRAVGAGPCELDHSGTHIPVPRTATPLDDLLRSPR